MLLLALQAVSLHDHYEWIFLVGASAAPLLSRLVTVRSFLRFFSLQPLESGIIHVQSIFCWFNKIDERIC